MIKSRGWAISLGKVEGVLFPEIKTCTHGRAQQVLFDYKLGCTKSIDVCPHCIYGSLHISFEYVLEHCRLIPAVAFQLGIRHIYHRFQKMKKSHVLKAVNQ